MAYDIRQLTETMGEFFGDMCQDRCATLTSTCVAQEILCTWIDDPGDPKLKVVRVGIRCEPLDLCPIKDMIPEITKAAGRAAVKELGLESEFFTEEEMTRFDN